MPSGGCDSFAPRAWPRQLSERMATPTVQVRVLNVKADCLVTHVTEHCDNTLGLDLQFEQFSRFGAQILQMFIEESAQASSHGPAKLLFQAGAASAHGEVTNAAPLA